MAWFEECGGPRTRQVEAGRGVRGAPELVAEAKGPPGLRQGCPGNRNGKNYATAVFYLDFYH